MTTKCVSLVSALALACPVAGAAAGEPARVIDPFLILVHPCPYEATGKAASDPYRALEMAACQRWFDAIPALPKTTFAVQVDSVPGGTSPDKLQAALIAQLGAGRVCRIPVEYQSPENPVALKDYYRRIDEKIRQQAAAQSLTFDAATCKTVIWGQSFEGCAAGYGSAIASGLGLKTLTHFDYAMSAPDAPFLLRAKFLETVAVPASDVEAYVFDLTDGRYAAFFRSCLTPQWLDRRPISLRLDPARCQVLSKQGVTLWPPAPPPTGPQSFELSTVQERFAVGRSLEDLRAVVRAATVKPGQ
jgi:hypothetical protein